MTKLEEKLKELGYNKIGAIIYRKGIIRLCVSAVKNKVYKSLCHLFVDNTVISNRNDIQKLKDNIDYYHEQLMIMYKDIEELEKCQD